MSIKSLILTIIETIIKVVILAVAVMYILRGISYAYDFGYRVFADEPVSSTEGLYMFFFKQTDGLGINREIANHLLRTYRAFLEGFIMLQIHNAFGNPIPMDESFEISMNVLLAGMEKYRR